MLIFSSDYDKLIPTMGKLKDIEIANSFVSRGVGLIGRKSFGKKAGLLLKNANAIHTFGVFFPIDVAFLDSDYKIIRLIENLKPFSFSPFVKNGKHVLEMPSGSIKKHSLQLGEKIDIIT